MLLSLTVAGWVLLELGVRVRESVQGRGRTGHDRFTRVLIAATIGATIALAVTASHTQSLRIPGPGRAVISTGPYARVRHPSYTGLLLILAGFGLALGDWRSLGICALLPLPALLLRIRVEEAELIRVLGDTYRRYQKQTKRLIPGLW